MSIESPFFIRRDPRVTVPTVIEDLARRGRILMSLDWSDFDQRVEQWEIKDAFALIKSIMTSPTN